MSKLKCALILMLLFFITACGNSSTKTAAPANSEFSNLSTVSKSIVGSDTLAAAIAGTRVYYTDRILGLSSIDITDPLNLTKQNTLVDPFHEIGNLNGYDTMYNFIIAGDIAIIAVNPACLGMCMGDGSEVRLYQLNPNNKPAQIATISIPADHMAVDGNQLYILSSNIFALTNTISIYDISTPSQPILKSTTAISDAGYLAKNGNILYVSQISYDTLDSGKFSKLQTIDVATPSTPVVENPTDGLAFNQTYAPILMTGNTLYYLDVLGLNVINIADRKKPVFIKTIALPGVSAKSFSSYKNKLYIAAGEKGVMVYDITQPENPVYLKAIRSNTAALSVTVVNGVGAYISDTLKQSSGGGYSIVEGNGVNLFFDK